MAQREDENRSEWENGSIGGCWRAGLAAAPVFAWVFSVFLSGTFYQGSDSVTNATVFAAAAAVAAAVALPAATAIMRRYPKVAGGRPVALMGLGALAGVSGAAGIGLALAISDVAFSASLGAIAGAGCALVAAAAVAWAAARSLCACFVSLAVAYGVGALLFLGLMAWISGPWLGVATAVFPVTSLLVVGLRPRWVSMPASCFAGSVGRGSLRSVLEPPSFATFAAVSGVLFGYCYNVYPKSTRFAGVHADALIGLVTPAAVAFLAAGLVVAVLVALISKMERGKRVYGLGCILLVTTATLYFNLPTMPTSPTVYVLVNCLACCAEVLVWGGLVLRWSQGAYDAFRSCLLCQMIGVAVGAVVGVFFIELTTPSPLVTMPVVLRDFMIVGMPTAGFIILAMLLFHLAQKAVFPPRPARPETLGLSDLAQATGEIARRFSLTPREEEILGMLLQGRSGPYIAEDLYLSKSTVKTHIRHIYDKIGISSRQQLIDKAHDACLGIESRG